MDTSSIPGPAIVHDAAAKRFWTRVDGHEAYATYTLHYGGLDIRHTRVPPAIGGRNIAAALVKAAYDYARAQGVKPLATCSYAAVWLRRHPDYHGAASPDYAGPDSCTL